MILLGFRGVALVVHHVTIYDNLVPYRHRRIASGKLLVAQIVDTIGRKLSAVYRAIIGHGERTIPKSIAGTAELVGFFAGKRRYLTLDKHFLGAVHIGAELIQVLDDTRHIVRILQGTVTIVHLTVGTGLVDDKAGTGKADGEDQCGGTVIGRVLRNSNFERLCLHGGLTVGRADSDPFRNAVYSPVTGGRERNSLGAAGHFKRKIRLIQSDLGRTEVHFFVTADEQCSPSHNSHEKGSKFHKVIIKSFIAYVLKYKYTTFFRLTQKKPGARGSLGVKSTRKDSPHNRP